MIVYLKSIVVVINGGPFLSSELALPCNNPFLDPMYARLLILLGWSIHFEVREITMTGKGISKLKSDENIRALSLRLV